MANVDAKRKLILKSSRAIEMPEMVNCLTNRPAGSEDRNRLRAVEVPTTRQTPPSPRRWCDEFCVSGLKVDGSEPHHAPSK